MKTLFIGRLSYDTTEEKLIQEYDEFGPIAKVRACVYARGCEAWGVLLSAHPSGIRR